MSTRLKLKGKSADEPDADVSQLLAEIRQLRQELGDMKKQNSEIGLLRHEVNDLKEHITALSVSLSEQHTDYINKLESADIEIEALKSSVSHLQHQLNAQEQYSMRNELEIIGVPEEDCENVTHVILTAAQKLGVQLNELDLDDVGRVGPKRPKGSKLETAGDRRPRPILVKLLRRQKRDEIVKAAKARRNLTTEGIMDGAPQKLYVNERLTKENRILFREVRLRASAYQFRFCWVRNGGIYVRKSEGKPGMRISTAAELEQRVGPVKASAATYPN